MKAYEAIKLEVVRFADEDVVTWSKEACETETTEYCVSNAQGGAG